MYFFFMKHCPSDSLEYVLESIMTTCREKHTYVCTKPHITVWERNKLSFLPLCLLISLILKIVLNCIVTPSEHFTSNYLPFTVLCCFPVCPETRT